ncbi:Intraflagellar transport protein 122 like [Schistosoma japonicum]|nr:Intraflagellar transport protein 122 like [Schistosoma japonicum]
MDTAQVWSIKIKGKDGISNCIWDICYSPDGSHLVVASGNLVWVYDANNASLVKSLKGHKDAVYCVSYAHDSSLFGSGSADKCVIIWKSSTLEGLVKYIHNESIQCLEFNPVTMLLASTGSTDFGFWTMDQKNVVKTKISARPTCCSWKSDGQFLAIGLYSGVISIRNKETQEVAKIERPCDSIIWNLKWNPLRSDYGEVLAVIDWNQKLSFYQSCGRQTGKDHTLGYDPCGITWFGDKYESIAICGSNRMCHLYSSEGVRLACISKQQSWIWCCCARKGYNQIIQLVEKILIYESPHDDMKDLHYRLREKFSQQIVCQHLIIITNNLVVCQDNCISCVNFKGIKEREWIVDSSVKCIRIIQIVVDNAFPIVVTKVLNEISMVDISRNQDKLAILDVNKTMYAFSMEKKEILFQEPNVLSMTWSTTNNDLIAYSGNNGITLSFTGTFVYCLHENTINRVEISLTPAVYHYLGNSQLNEAYHLGCFGLTEQDWKIIGRLALNKLNLKVAKYAYMQLEDVLILLFIQQLEERYKRGEWTDKDTVNNSNISIVLGDISAYLGNFTEAVVNYNRASGQQHKIIEMYTDLRRFNEVHEIMSTNCDVNERKLLLAKNADWAKSTNEYREAAKMYIDAGEYIKAIELSDQHGWTDIRRLDKGDHEYLERCARSLTRLGEYAFAADCYAKYGDIENQLNLHIESHNWEEAFTLVEKHHVYTRKVYLPYANWLAENDKFEEAQAAFIKAGLQNEAISVLEQLATCAAKESRFDDAVTETVHHDLLEQYYDFQRKADVYYVYHHIYRFLFSKVYCSVILFFEEEEEEDGNILLLAHEPFASHMPETYFNMARYLTHILQFGDVAEVSKAAVLYTLAKHGRKLGAYKLTKQIYNKLQSFHLPFKMRNEVDLCSITLNSGPMTDSEEINPMCYRCSTINPLINSLEQLPIVEFIPEDDLSYEEVINYLQSDTSSSSSLSLSKNVKHENEDNVEMNNNYSQTFKISHKQENSMLSQDPFMAKLLNSDLISEAYSPVQLDIATLKAISFNEVIIINNSPLKPRFYKSILPDVSITQCSVCHKLFYSDDYEMVTLQQGRCPYCHAVKE